MPAKRIACTASSSLGLRKQISKTKYARGNTPKDVQRNAICEASNPSESANRTSNYLKDLGKLMSHRAKIWVSKVTNRS